MAQAYVSRTRVLKVGNARVTVYDGQTTTSPRQRKADATGGATRKYDPDEF